MQAAKDSIKSFVSKAGHHDTSVEEHVQPAVTSETIKPQRHEEVTSAVDREVHQHHHHTTVQPLEHQEVLPEQHSHQTMPVEHREFQHGDDHHIKQKLADEAARFKNTSTTHQTQHTQSAAPTVTGEHVHHHVHETVQPVINKETIQPEVVHTTVPVHETHIAQAEHHGISMLPTKTMAEFEKLGGGLGGSKTQHTEKYEGHPRPYNPEFQMERNEVDKDFASHDGLHGSTGTSTGHHHIGMTGANTGMTGGNTGMTGGNTGMTGGNSGMSGGNFGTTESTGRDTLSGGNKPSMADKMNPKIDADGDGKAGIMD